MNTFGRHLLLSDSTDTPTGATLPDTPLDPDSPTGDASSAFPVGQPLLDASAFAADLSLAQFTPPLLLSVSSDATGLSVASASSTNVSSTNASVTLPALVTLLHPGTPATLSSPASPTGGLDIIVAYDTSVSVAAMGQTLFNEFTSAVSAAVTFYENEITTHITVHLNFGWGEINGSTIDPGAAGESEHEGNTYTYSQLYNAIKAVDTAPTASAVQQAAFALLGTTDPTGGTGHFDVSTAEGKALGLSNYTGTDGWVGLDSTLNYNFTQSNITATQFDAVGILEHEVSEDLGRYDDLGSDNDYTLLDFYHYTAAGNAAGAAPGSAAGTLDQPFVAGYNSNSNTAPDAYFSYNGSTITLPYDTPTQVAQGDDVADWTDTVNGDSYGFADEGSLSKVSATDLKEMSVLGYTVVCYAKGTRILTDRGERAVEALAIGDRVITHAGVARPLRWIGRRSYEARFVVGNPNICPVLIRAGAIAAGVPRRDLCVSPCHAMYLDGLLIPAAALINGTTILRAPLPDSVEYFHLELETHDVIVAEGAPSETYIDLNNRWMFQNAGEYAAVEPRSSGGATGEYAPRCEQGAAVAAVWSRLATRAGSLGFQPALPQVIVVEAMGLNRAQVPAGVTELRLWSGTGYVAGDRRPLGALISAIRIDGVTMALTDPNLLRGFHEVERHGQVQTRWTNGEAVVAIGPAPAERIIEIEVAAVMQNVRAA